MNLLHQSSVFAGPYLVGNDGNDGLPTVLVEAMALGTPCVATTVTGVPEVIRSGETGLLVEPGEPEWSHAAIDQSVERSILSVLEVNGPLVEEQATHRGLVHREEAEAMATSLVPRRYSRRGGVR